MKLDHVQLAMPAGREDQARAFFGGILGMREEEKPEPLSTRGGAWFRKGAVILHVGVDERFTPQEKAHVAFIIQDLTVLATKLIAEDYPVRWDDALPDRRRFYTVDPFGNRLEFIQEGDGFSQK